MPNPTPQERTSIRMTCDGLRKLLAAEKPAGIVAILQDVGNIECDAVTATGDEFQEVSRSLNDLVRSLRDLGIITSQNGVEFSGEPD